MGHGVRDESDDTQLFFVTSGYLVQLLAHNKNACKSLTHIIIDEVCAYYLCKQGRHS